MNCEQTRRRIIDALASGLVKFPPELSEHVALCSACSRFQERQTRLFAAIDSGLALAINHPVPASLLPGVRARLDAMSAHRSAVPLVGRQMVFALILVLVTGVGMFWRTQPQKEPIAKVIARPTASAIAVSAQPVKGGRARKKVNPNRAPYRGTRGQAASQFTGPEVLVRPEEAWALAHLANTVQRQPDWAKAMLRQALLSSTDMSAIPAIQIKDVMVPRLDSEKW